MQIRTSLIFCASALLVSAAGDAAERRAGDVTDERVMSEAPGGSNWLVNGGNFNGEHFSPLKQINDRNVTSLGLAWATDIPGFTLNAEPIVVDGVAYLSTNLNVILAIDASNGEILWRYDPKPDLGISFSSSVIARMSRGVAVYQGKVFLGTGDCQLIGLDASTGAELWRAQVCDASVADGAGVSNAPRVADGKVFTGHSGSDAQRRGSIGAWDPDTGEELWRFWTVPDDPAKGPAENPQLEAARETWTGGWAKTGGGAVWEGIRYDPVTDLLIFGTSSVSPLNVKLRGPGDNLFTNCLMAVDADTGEYRWHYQTVPEDAWDYDASMPIIVTDLEFPGKGSRRVVLQAPKNGFFYALDARTGELISADPFVDVTWASHVDMKTGRPVVISAAKYYDNEDPTRPVRVVPPAMGAHNWQAMSFSPATGLVYLPVINMPTTYSAGGYFGARTELMGYGPEEEVPMGAGRLLAWDPVARSVRWAVDYPLPFNGGALSTAGNVVFHGTAGGDLVAYRADNGSRLWSAYTGSTMTGAPVSYTLGDAQYVLAAGGRGGNLGMIAPSRAATESARGPARLFAFKLGGEAPMPKVERDPVPIPKPPARTASTEQVERGAGLYEDLGCGICHGSHAMGIGERRLEGFIPDLRYIPTTVHEEWHGVLLGGNRRTKGMPNFSDSISVEDSEAIHAYVIDAAWKAYEKQERASAR